MKKYIYLLSICLFASCDSYFINMQPMVVTMDAFEKTGALYSDAEVELLLFSGKLGESRQNAAVGLVFDQYGILMTAKEYNSLFGPDATRTATKLIYKYTDLTTFRNITGQKEANANYTKVMPLTSNRGVYLFDYLQTKYLTFLDEDKLIDKILNSLPKRGANNAAATSAERDTYTTDLGDFFVNPSKSLGEIKDSEGNLIDPALNDISKLGHAAGSLGSSGIYSSFAELARRVITAEAQGYSCDNPNLPPYPPCDRSYIPSLNDEVAFVPMTKYWINQNPTAFKTGVEMWTNVSYSIASRMSRFWNLSANGSGLTIYDVKAIKDYNPTDYFITGDGTYSKTYCSLFLWQAIYNKTSKRINVDEDGGRWCFPNDIVRDGNNKDHFILMWRLI